MIYITVSVSGNVTLTSAEWADAGEAGLASAHLTLPMES